MVVWFLFMSESIECCLENFQCGCVLAPALALLELLAFASPVPTPSPRRCSFGHAAFTPFGLFAMPFDGTGAAESSNCIPSSLDSRHSGKLSHCCSSATFMSGMFFTNSRRKSKRLSDIMHCFICDGDNVFALRAFVMRSVLVSIDSTNNSSVLGIYLVTENSVLFLSKKTGINNSKLK